jgi:hypothetical protein
MPIQFPPALFADAQARKARLIDEATRNAQSAVGLQDQIDGNAGPAPGLQPEEDVQADLYNQYEARIAYFESERRALDGVFASPVVTATEINDAAKGVRPSGPAQIFPVPPGPFPGNLDPVYVSSLQGIGGADPNNETAQKVTELARIVTLLSLLPANRLANPAYGQWVASLNAQSALLATQIAAGTANESYGGAHAAVVAATAEKADIDALLPSPGITNLILTTRQGVATARQATLPARVAVLVADVLPFNDNRYLVLKGRVRVAQGTLSKVLAAQSSIDVLGVFVQLNNDTIALYTALGA